MISIASINSCCVSLVARRRYVYRKTGRDVMTCVQLLRQGNKQLFLSSVERFQKIQRKSGPGAVTSATPTDRQRVTANVAICVEELKLLLLAKSCIVPGLPNLLFFLVKSFGDNDSMRVRHRACASL
jgi:hypothetical protein